jgi:hypothetical protein
MSAFLFPFHVRVEQLLSPVVTPLPLESGFTYGKTYQVLGCVEHDPSGELYLILSNDRNEIWRISNRHLRVVSHPKECPSYLDPCLWENMQELE